MTVNPKAEETILENTTKKLKAIPSPEVTV
jgi:hypothetical protein